MKTRDTGTTTSVTRGALIAVMLGAVGAVAGIDGQPTSAEEVNTVANPHAPTHCTLQKLQVPEPELDNHVTGVDPSGTYIAGRSHDDGVYRAWLWQDGEAQYLNAPSDRSALKAINTSGMGVGYSEGDDQRDIPWTFVGGDITQLPELGDARLVDINENGDFIGNDDQPFMVRAGQTEATYLELPDEALEGVAYSLNDEGTVVGRISTGDPDNPDYEPYLWDANGNGMTLPWPDGHEDAFGYAQSIQGEWITGLVHIKGMKWHYTPQDGATAHVVDDLDSPWDTSPSNVTVGTYDDGDTYRQARMVTPEGNVELPGLNDVKSDTSAEAISAAATVVAGTSEDGLQDAQRAVSWTCA